jgi:hypothetical protein
MPDTTTANFGWTKPAVNDPAGANAWGGKINADLDSIDAVVANSRAFRNRLINGNMALDQRNESAAVTANATYGPDRWKFYANVPGHLTLQRGTLGAPAQAATHANYSLVLGNAASAYAPAASDLFVVLQDVEADTVADLMFGSASALPIVLSFWAYLGAGATGLYSGSIRNGAASRSYVFTYNIPALATWTYFQIAIPGDTAGTWLSSGNGAALIVTFDGGTGSTYQTTAGSWQALNFTAATGANKLVATASAQLFIANIQLEAGTVATPFEVLPPEINLQRAARYYEKSYAAGTAPGATTAVLGLAQTAMAGLPSAIYTPLIVQPFKTPKRAQPTVTLYSPTTANASGKVRDYVASVDLAGSATAVAANSFSIYVAANAAATNYNIGAHWTADADF